MPPGLGLDKSYVRPVREEGRKKERKKERRGKTERERERERVLLLFI
jgi:hypothetical protein